MTTIQITGIFVLLLIIVFLQGWILFAFLWVKNQKENEYYTDYVHNKLILRVYKPEFEYHAIGKIPREKILDGGNLTMTYKWALLEK